MTSDSYDIRRGRPDEAELLRAVERAAGARFRAFGLDAVADSEPTPAQCFADRAVAGRLFVAADAFGDVVGFAYWRVLGDVAFIEELSVLPAHGGRRLGAQLIDAIADQARADGLGRLALTTFADVPWNAPYYLRLGFTELVEPAAGPELAGEIARDRAHVPGGAARVCLTRRVPELAGRNA